MFARVHTALLFTLGTLSFYGCPAEPDPGPGPGPAQDLGPRVDGGSLDAGMTGQDAGFSDLGPRPDTGIIAPDLGVCDEPEPRGNVRYKRARRVELHFTRALGITPAELCNELGTFNCVGIHQVALGGVDPYNLGLYQPLPFTTATTPLAVDRLALHGCRERVTQDLSDAEALIFSGLNIDAQGGLNVDTPEVEQAIDTLYRRIVQRRASAEEIALLKGLYSQLQAEGSTQPARDWAILSCYSVLTTLESLFY